VPVADKAGHSKMLSTVTPPQIAGNILIIYHWFQPCT